MAWILNKEEKYTLFSPNLESHKDIDNSISNLPKDGNKIVDCSSLTLTESQIELLSIAYQKHVANNVSFLVVISDIENMDLLEKYFVVVPTISEAIDYIYMEEFERNI
jgi:hypothetical protein